MLPSPITPKGPSEGAADLLDEGVGIVSLGGAMRLVSVAAASSAFRLTPDEMMGLINDLNGILAARGLPVVPVLALPNGNYVSHHALDLSLAVVSDPYCTPANYQSVISEYKGLTRYQVRERLARLSDDFFSAIRTKVRRKIYDAQLAARKADLGIAPNAPLPIGTQRTRGVKPGSATPATRRQPKPSRNPPTKRSSPSPVPPESLGQLPSEALRPTQGTPPSHE